MATTTHGPKGHPLFGMALIYNKDPLAFLVNTSEEYKDISKFRFAHLPMLMLYHPDYVQYVLQKNHKNYKKGFEYKYLMHILGEGLLTSEGTFWLRQRRLAQPAFHKDRIAGFCDMMVDSIDTMCDKWEAHPDGHTFDVFNEMMGLTLDIVARTMFSAKVVEHTSEIGTSLGFLIEDSMARINAIVAIPLWIPTPQNRKVHAHKRVLDEVLLEVIRKRRESGEVKNDLLQMLMDARDEDTNEQMNDQQLRDEAMTIFLAGHETTANALTWALYMLSENPEVEQKLHEELDAVLQGRKPTLEDTRKLSYTMMVIKETMRLYPPAWLVGRSPLDDDEVLGHPIKKKDNVLIVPWLTHRLPEFWEDPLKFDPERFTPEKEKKMHSYQYYPFGGGPRLCIGNNFAMLEMQLSLAMIAQKYKLRHEEGHVVEPEPLITLRPKYGMRMHLMKR